MTRKQAFCALYGHKAKILGDYPDAQVEVCTECGKDLIYNKAKDGTIDNRRYYEEHLRDFAQPTGKTAGIFARFYGKPKDTKTEEDAMWDRREEQRMENWRRGMKDTGNEGWAKRMKNVVKRDK